MKIGDTRTLLRACTLALAMVLTSGCAKNDPSTFIASAKGYLDKSDYKSAVIQLKSALQVAPENAEARFLLGKALLGGGDPAAAETEVRKALDLRYPADDAYPLLAKTLLAQGQFQKVVSDLGSVRLTDKQAQADIGTALAGADLALGDVKAARATIDSALNINPKDPHALTLLARLDAMGNDMPSAVKNIDAALAAAPNDTDALILKSELLSAQGKRDEAIKTLEGAVAANTYATNARFLLVSLLVSSGQVDKAAVQLDAMKKMAPTEFRTLYSDALVSYARGNATYARDVIQKVLASAPDNVESLYLSGLINFQLGSFSVAEDALRRVVQKAPGEMNSSRMLALTYLRTGRPTQAIEVIEQVSQQRPNDPTLLRVAAEAYLAAGNTTRAAQLYERANSIDTNNVASKVRLAEVRVATGDSGKAMKDLESLSASDSTQYQADLALITQYVRRGDFDRALASMATLETKQPNNPLTYNVKGSIYMNMRDYKNARASFEKALQIDPNYFAAAHNLAQLDVQQRKPEDAKKRYEQMLAKDPKNEMLLLSLAELLGETRRPQEEVKAAIDRAITANPQSARARLAMIAYYSRLQDTRSALTTAQTAEASFKTDPTIVEALGVTQMAAGDTNQAIETFNHLVQLQPQSANALMRLADAQAATRDFNGATASLQKAVEVQPDLPAAWVALAKSFVIAGKPEGALDEAKKIQKDHPDKALGFALEGEVYAAQRKWPEAAVAYREGLAHEAIPLLAVRYYATLQNMGKTADAATVADKWIKENPKDVTMHLYMAERAQTDKDLKTAATHYRAALTIAPDNALTLNNLAWVLTELGDPKAKEYAERAYTAAPYTPSVVDTYGWSLLQGGEAAKGTEFLRTALSLDPSNDEIRMHVATALMKTGDKVGAKKELETLSKGAKTQPLRADAEKMLSGM
jgi:putative PEP-CTERM system TPR-repeat lipoprotein